MLISKEQIKQIVSLHPLENRKLIEKQIMIMDNLISLTEKKYKSDKEYRNIMDQILGIIMQGNFANIKEENND